MTVDSEAAETIHRHGSLTLRAVLPPGVRVRQYMSNHHYVELADENGNVIRLEARSLIKGRCEGCGQGVYVESRIGTMACPHCQGNVIWGWGKAQIAFVPDKESRFSSYPPPAADPREDTPARKPDLRGLTDLAPRPIRSGGSLATVPDPSDAPTEVPPTDDLVAPTAFDDAETPPSGTPIVKKTIP